MTSSAESLKSENLYASPVILGGMYTTPTTSTSNNNNRNISSKKYHHAIPVSNHSERQVKLVEDGLMVRNSSRGAESVSYLNEVWEYNNPSWLSPELDALGSNGGAQLAIPKYESSNVDAPKTFHKVSTQQIQLTGLEMKKRYRRALRAKSIFIEPDEVEMLEQVGMGSFGIVYKGRYKGADVALQEEALKLLKLKTHPNVCIFIGMINVCDDPQQHALIFQWVRDGSVDDVLASGHRFSELDKLNILRQAASGIWSLHDQDVIHRDLALRNILIDLNSIHAYVTDFGLSHETGEFCHSAMKSRRKKNQSECIMPIAWSAPESLKNGTFSKKSDVFSFGVLCWEIFTESIPFQGESLNQLIIDIPLGKRLEVDEMIPNSIHNLLKDCWMDNPESRPDIKTINSSLEDAFNICQSDGGDFFPLESQEPI